MAAVKQLRIGEVDISSEQVASEIDLLGVLQEITRNAQHLTGASGAALVLTDGKIMTCRASSGEMAPPIGTRLNIEIGFTATCVRTAEVLRCDDAQTDARVDVSSCAKLGIRSILAVPLFDAQAVVGVFELLSNKPAMFTQQHARALQLFARLVENVLHYVPRYGRAASSLRQEPRNIDSDKANSDKEKLTCLSCGHPNPQASRFCNRCGIVLLASIDPQHTNADLTLPEHTESGVNEGLSEIYKLIAGNAERATWSEIYPKLLANLQSMPTPDKPAAIALQGTAKKEATGTGFGSAQATTGLKARVGVAVRQSPWL
jgi:hypothetical protein